MKNGWKKRLAALAILLASVCFAPGAMAQSAPVTRKILEGMGNIKAVNQTQYVIVQSAETERWGVFNTAGEQLIPFDYDSLAYLSRGYFVTSRFTDPLLNGKALVSPTGERLSEFSFGMFKMYSEHWAAGWVVSAADSKAYDHKVDSKTYYNIDRCVIFSLDAPAHPVATFERTEFKEAAGHGKYLSVADREGNVTVYGPDFEPTGFSAAKVSDNVYGVSNYALKDKISGEIILDGVTASKEVNTVRGLYFQVTRTGFDGKKQQGICNLDGEWLMPLGDWSIKTVTKEYAVVTQSGLQGLYSFDRGRLILPCQYTSILSSSQTTDAYVFYGYACGAKDGVRYYVNVETGRVEQEQPYDSEQMKTMGGTVYYRNEWKKYVLLAADGRQKVLQNYTLVASRGDGSLIVAKGQDGRYGVMTVYGQEVLTFWYINKPVLTDDGKIILNTKSGFDLVEVIR